MARHNDTGKWGEEIACKKLITDGCAIVERNWRSNAFEVDIIAMRGNAIVFVEVKTRGADGDDPYDALTPDKLRQMLRAANSYVQKYDVPHEIQFDFFAISGDEHSYTIDHIEDMTMPLMRTTSRRK